MNRTTWHQNKQNECNLSSHSTSLLFLFSAAGVKWWSHDTDEAVILYVASALFNFDQLTNPGLIGSASTVWKGLVLNCDKYEVWQTVLTLCLICLIWYSHLLHLSSSSFGVSSVCRTPHLLCSLLLFSFPLSCPAHKKDAVSKCQPKFNQISNFFDVMIRS